MQTWGAAISAGDAGRLAWALSAMDALHEDALQALAPQLGMLASDDTATLAALFQARHETAWNALFAANSRVV